MNVHWQVSSRNSVEVCCAALGFKWASRAGPDGGLNGLRVARENAVQISLDTLQVALNAFQLSFDGLQIGKSVLIGRLQLVGG